jgi:hypothetical protein
MNGARYLALSTDKHTSSVSCYYCTGRGRHMHISFSAKCLKKERISNGYVDHEELHGPRKQSGFSSGRNDV